jgi:hypothetical protein
MPTGAHKMHHSHCQRICDLSPLTNPNPSVVIFFLWGGCPILWKAHKEARISHSSCEAEIKATDECVKNVQMFRHTLHDLDLLDLSTPSNGFNDNHGAVDWSNSFSMKGMRHVNIRENAVREARVNNEVSIQHIPGPSNPADMFSKEFKSNSTFRTFQGLTLFYPSSLQKDTVPCLDGGC